MKVRVTLQYKERSITFVPELEYSDWDHAYFMWVEGNWACDCNKSIFWDDEEPFPEMDCGDDIELVDLQCAECSADLLADKVQHKLSCSEAL